MLAPEGRVCLTPGVVHAGRTFCRPSHLPKAALSGVLAVLLLAAMTFSVSPALHHLIHHEGAGSDHFCLACVFAKGQVNAAVVALIPTTLVLSCLWRVRLINAVLFTGCDYRTSPTRAPPHS